MNTFIYGVNWGPPIIPFFCSLCCWTLNIPFDLYTFFNQGHLQTVLILHHKQTHTHTPTHLTHGTYGVLDCLLFCGQSIEFPLWGTIVPLNFLVGYHCSIPVHTHMILCNIRSVGPENKRCPHSVGTWNTVWTYTRPQCFHKLDILNFLKK